MPPVSIWELKEAQRRASDRGVDKENEKAIFNIITEQRALEAESAAKTKTARRAQQKRVLHEKQRKDIVQAMPKLSKPLEPSAPPPGVKGYNPDNVEALDDD